MYAAPEDPEKTYVYEEDSEGVGGLVGKHISNLSEFDKGTRVCTAKDSISKDILAKNKNLVIDDSDVDYHPCVQKLIAGVEKGDPFAAITDTPIVMGFAATYDSLKVLPYPIRGTTTHWGVGMAENDPALKQLVCRSITEQFRNGDWEALKNQLIQLIGKEGEESIIAPWEEADRTECKGIA